MAMDEFDGKVDQKRIVDFGGGQVQEFHSQHFADGPQNFLTRPKTKIKRNLFDLPVSGQAFASVIALVKRETARLTAMKTARVRLIR